MTITRLLPIKEVCPVEDCDWEGTAYIGTPSRAVACELDNHWNAKHHRLPKGQFTRMYSSGVDKNNPIIIQVPEPLWNELLNFVTRIEREAIVSRDMRDLASLLKRRVGVK